MAEPMTAERAHEISNCMIRVWYHGTHGIGQAALETDQTQLEAFTLAEMLEAQKVVQGLSGQQITKPSGEKVTRLYQVLDDRLVAAIYTWAHYEGEAAPCSPIVAGEGKALVCVKLTPGVMGDGEVGA